MPKWVSLYRQLLWLGQCLDWLCCHSKIPYGVDELTVSCGSPRTYELIKCKTVDVEVPATAEIVIEGELPTDSMERRPLADTVSSISRIWPYLNVTRIQTAKIHLQSSSANAQPSRYTKWAWRKSNLYKSWKYLCLPSRNGFSWNNVALLPFSYQVWKRRSSPNHAVLNCASPQPRRKLYVVMTTSS